MHAANRTVRHCLLFRQIIPLSGARAPKIFRLREEPLRIETPSLTCCSGETFNFIKYLRVRCDANDLISTKSSVLRSFSIISFAFLSDTFPIN